MKQRKFLWFLKMAFLGITFILLTGWVVMSLWNWILPATLGAGLITFWQALGLVFLTRLLVGGFRGRGHRGPWRRRMHHRWKNMTDEEREAFKDRFAGRCSDIPSAAQQ